jgi:hypothetical protein
VILPACSVLAGRPSRIGGLGGGLPRPDDARMTALERYAKLEAVARYLDGVSSEAREVVLSFGERSLVIMGLDDRPIAHWPLASLRALGPPAERPLELVPDRGSDERLLLEDGEMSAAIAEVCPELHPPAVPPRRWLGRAVLGAAVLAGGAALCFLVLPHVPDRLSDMVPAEREAALGAAAAARIPALLAGDASGSVPALCVAEQGAAALRTLVARLDPAGGPPLRVSVLDHPGVGALGLPGGQVVIQRGLIDRARSPEEVAAVLAHAAGHAAARDALNAALDRGGLGAAAILFGDNDGGWAASAAAEAALAPDRTPEAEARADAAAFDTLAAAGLPIRPLSELMARLAAEPGPPPYLSAHPWSPGRAAGAAAADAVGDAPFMPALSDRDWIALTAICDRTVRGRAGQ